MATAANSSALPTPPAAGEQQVASLDQLRDIHLPAEIGLWPPAIGWWLLGGLLLAVTLIAGYFAWQHWQRNRYRRQALLLLGQYRQQLQQQGDRTHYLSQLSQLLRRTALSAYPEQPIASLSEQQWQQWLARVSGIVEFEGEVGRAIASGPYRAHTEFDAEQLHTLTARWIKSHPRRCPC